MNSDIRRPDGTGPLAVLSRFRSKSVPGLVYEVRIRSDNRVYCTCPGWIHHQERDCRHMRDWRNTGTKGDA